MTLSRIPLVTPTNENAGEGEVAYHEENGRCILQVRYAETEVTGEGSDYFEALCVARLQLETRGLLVACYGGSRTVFPSGMARDMGAGLKAYRLTRGRPARREDLVGIFETSTDVEPATVDEQRAFFQEWLVSIRAT